MHVRPYQKLIVWQESHKLCLAIYQVTEKFPASETYRLVNQMRRSAFSVPTNIAEGSGKKSKRERDRFYETSTCSLEELHYECLLSKDLGYLTEQKFSEFDEHIMRVSYLLMKLRASLS